MKAALYLVFFLNGSFHTEEMFFNTYGQCITAKQTTTDLVHKNKGRVITATCREFK